MKKYFVYLCITCVIALSSCKKFLETLPTDSVVVETYYNTESQLNTALNSVYDILQQSDMYSISYLNVWNAGTDEGYNRYAGTVTGSGVYNYNSSDAVITNVWRQLYIGIDRANSLLENIDKPVMSEANRNVIKGQALFLRAYYYFLLVQNWGNIPLRLTSSQSVNNLALAAASPVTVYQQITNDMITAEGLVNPISSYTTSGRISKSAVQGVLARVYLNWAGYPLSDHSKYAEALKWAIKVRDSGLHSLNPDFKQVFINYAKDIYDTKESIWEVEFSGNGTGSINEAGRVGSQNGLQCDDVTIGISAGVIRTTEKLYKMYDATKDLRRDWCISSYYYSGTSNAVKVFYGATDIYSRSLAKWRREYEVLTPKNSAYTPENVPILRYSDILLMIAEAENEVNGPTSTAIDAVNQVRQRAYGTGNSVTNITLTNGGSGYTTVPTVSITSNSANNGATATATISGGKVTGITINSAGALYTSTPVVSISGTSGTGATATATVTPINPTDANLTAAQTSSKENLRQAIQDERLRELCGEGFRRNDLIRWGIFVTTLKALGSQITSTVPTSLIASCNNVSDRHVLFPIPQAELSVNNLLHQNPNW